MGRPTSAAARALESLKKTWVLYMFEMDGNDTLQCVRTIVFLNSIG